MIPWRRWTFRICATAKATPWKAWPRVMAIASLPYGLRPLRPRCRFRAYSRDHFGGIDGPRLTRGLLRRQQHDLGIGFVIGAHHHIHQRVIGKAPAAPIAEAAAPAPEGIRWRQIGNRLHRRVRPGVAGVEH